MKHPRRYQIASLMRKALAPMVASIRREDGLVTIRRILLNGNYSVATVTYTIVGGGLTAAEAQQLLEEAAAAYRLQLARGLNMRKTPKLVFRHDDEELGADKMRDFLDNIDAGESD